MVLKSHIWMVFACFWVHSIFFTYLYDWFLFVTCCSMSQGYFSFLLSPSKIWRQNFVRNEQLFWRPIPVMLDRASLRKITSTNLPGLFHYYQPPFNIIPQIKSRFMIMVKVENTVILKYMDIRKTVEELKKSTLFDSYLDR